MEVQEQAPNNNKTIMVFMTIAKVDGQLFMDQTGCFPDVENFIASYNTTHQYPPPDINRTNPAEHAIRTWKNHFVAIRAGTPSTYRLPNWCKDFEQTDITLNMMCPCTQNPKLLAHEAMEGMFSFDSTPMAPIGTVCMVHVKPSQRQTWGYYAIKAQYFAPTLSHYRCIKVVTDTGAVPITPTDRILKATKDLTQAIKNHTTPAPDELEAITALKAVITGTPPDPPLPEPATEAPPHDIIDTVEHYKDEPVSLPLHTTPMPSPLPPTYRPTAIPLDDDKLDNASGISTIY
eukprot:CCRYP_008139-RA/>CCRYP_008139-RA protein AED:0.40 eAED:0.40 QI:0/0/0/1/0/0/3/0/289